MKVVTEEVGLLGQTFGEEVVVELQKAVVM